VVHFDRAIPRHHDFFHQELDHRLAVFESQAVDMAPEQGAEALNIVRQMFPLDGRVTLMFDLFSFLLKSLEPWRDLLPPGRQVLQGEYILLIRVNKPLQLSLSVVPWGIHTLQLVLELPLLPLLDLLPERIFLQNGLGLLQQFAHQGPHEGIEAVGPHKPRWASLDTARRHGVLPRTLIVEVGVAFAHAPLLGGLHMQLTMPTPYESPQQIALGGRLIGTTRLCLIPL
jgi:hypothetical protein